MFRAGVAGTASLRLKEVMNMQRCLLVLDMDLLAMDEEHDLEPISYLVARQEREPCEVVVLSLTANRPKMPVELLAGAGIPQHPDLAHRPDDDISVNAEHRKDRAVQHLANIGCQASGIISYDDLVTAVGPGTRAPPYH